MAISKPTVGTTGWNTAVDAVIDHANDTATNPHAVTKAQVGLANVNNTSDAAKPISTAAQAALDAKLATAPALPSGYYFYTISSSGVATSNTLGNGNLRVAPWRVERTVTLSRLGAEVSVVGDAGSKLRLAIYSDNGSTYPGSLVLDAGQIAADSATVQELVVSVTLQPGLYWVGAAVQSVTTTQPTVRTNVASWQPPVPVPVSTTLPTAGSGTVGFSASSVTGTAPSTYPAGASLAGSCPRLFAKVS